MLAEAIQRNKVTHLLLQDLGIGLEIFERNHATYSGTTRRRSPSAHGPGDIDAGPPQLRLAEPRRPQQRWRSHRAGSSTAANAA